MRVGWLGVVLVACASDGSKSPSAMDSAANTSDPDAPVGDTALDTADDPADPIEPPVYTQGTCPELVDGANAQFPHAGGAHNLRIELPDDPIGAPVLFAWHWLGGDARQLVASMELDALADEQGVIVVAPVSAGRAYEWAFTSPPEGNPDLALFTDLLACLHTQWSVDLSRIWTTGMSAGGMWTTYLTMHRSEWLAASVPLSGGTFPGSYVTPASTLPVMVVWGGPDDTYGSGPSQVNFEELSLDFSQNLQDDGHFVVECVHDRAHTLPPNASELVWRFVSSHTKDAPTPWTSGLPDDMPEWCRVP